MCHYSCFSLTGWTLKTKTTFGKDSPIFLLGSCYTIRPDGKYIDIEKQESTCGQTHID